MPIIALVLSSLIGWFFYWFFRLDGHEHVRAALMQRRDVKRRQEALSKERSAPINAVDDPRDAALVLMLLIAREATAPTREQYAAVEEKARTVFGFDRDLAEHMTQARFVAGRADSFEQAAGLLSKLLKSRLTDGECKELIEMIETIAAHDGPSDAQREAIDTLKRRLWPT